MELERALFRVHQRCLESEEFGKWRHRCERVVPALFGALLCSLVCAHGLYVGQSRCLPEALRRGGLWNATGPALPADAVLGVAVGDAETGSAQPSWTTTAAASAVPVPTGAAANASRAQVSYTFTFDRELLTMKHHLLTGHGFRVYNVSLSAECLAGGGTGLAYAVARLAEGYDGFVVNELAYTFNSAGYVVKLPMAGAKGDFFAWTAEEVRRSAPGRGFAVLWRKLMLLVKSVMSFALLSAITGAFIRVAVNASAVLLFTLSAAFPASSVVQGGWVPSLRMLSRVFPWIGVHVAILRGVGRPLGPLLKARVEFLLLQTLTYLGCSLTWRVSNWRLSPDGYIDHVFGLYSALELFNLVCVRTSSTAVAFPKLVGACVVVLHFYCYLSLFPCHWLMLATVVVGSLWVALYCLSSFEEPALQGDPFLPETPTAAHPRGVYMPQLSPSWTLEAAPLWTMFWPVDAASTFPRDALRHIADQEYLGV